MNNEQTPALREAVENMRNMRESYNDLAKEINEDKKAIIHEMQLSGLDIDDNASMAEVAERMREYTLLVRGNTEFVEGSYIRSIGDAMFAGLTSKEATAIETDLAVNITSSWMSQQGNTFLKRFNTPNAEGITNTYLSGCTGLEYLNCPPFNFVFNGFDFPLVQYCSCALIYNQCADVEYLSFVYWENQYAASRNYLRHLLIRSGDVSGYRGVRDKSIATPLLYDYRDYQVISADYNASFYGKNVNMAGESMVILTDYDDPNQPHFANNGEKMLWYFKHHFLYHDDGTPAFADMSETDAPTLTLGANLRDLVMADADVAEYFTSRNWIVA